MKKTEFELAKSILDNISWAIKHLHWINAALESPNSHGVALFAEESGKYSYDPIPLSGHDNPVYSFLKDLKFHTETQISALENSLEKL